MSIGQIPENDRFSCWLRPCSFRHGLVVSRTSHVEQVLRCILHHTDSYFDDFAEITGAALLEIELALDNGTVDVLAAPDTRCAGSMNALNVAAQH